METLKAHAVRAASYVVYVATQLRHNAYGFDVCTGQHCQVYQGPQEPTPRQTPRLR